MPWAPKRPCTHPGCAELTLNGRCFTHQRMERRELDKKRGGSTSRGYGIQWQLARSEFLRKHPLCQSCHAIGKLVPAMVVDHIVPHKQDQKAFWNVANWQALCKSCHDKKTTREGRWG